MGGWAEKRDLWIPAIVRNEVLSMFKEDELYKHIAMAHNEMFLN